MCFVHVTDEIKSLDRDSLLRYYILNDLAQRFNINI
jgi:hypothetical protein